MTRRKTADCCTWRSPERDTRATSRWPGIGTMEPHTPGEETRSFPEVDATSSHKPVSRLSTAKPLSTSVFTGRCNTALVTLKGGSRGMKRRRKKRTVKRGGRPYIARVTYREAMDLDAIAQHLLDIVHQAAPSDVTRWARLGQDCRASSTATTSTTPSATRLPKAPSRRSAQRQSASFLTRQTSSVVVLSTTLRRLPSGESHRTRH